MVSIENQSGIAINFDLIQDELKAHGFGNPKDAYKELGICLKQFIIHIVPH